MYRRRTNHSELKGCFAAANSLVILGYTLSPKSIRFLSDKLELQIIDIAGIEGSYTGNRHAYFRNSPWVSNDILISLIQDLEQENLVLVKLPDQPEWRFPIDYIRRLKDALLFSEP